MTLPVPHPDVGDGAAGGIDQLGEQRQQVPHDRLLVQGVAEQIGVTGRHCVARRARLGDPVRLLHGAGL